MDGFGTRYSFIRSSKKLFKFQGYPVGKVSLTPGLGKDVAFTVFPHSSVRQWIVNTARPRVTV